MFLEPVYLFRMTFVQRPKGFVLNWLCVPIVLMSSCAHSKKTAVYIPPPETHDKQCGASTFNEDPAGKPVAHTKAENLCSALEQRKLACSGQIVSYEACSDASFVVNLTAYQSITDFDMLTVKERQTLNVIMKPKYFSLPKPNEISGFSKCLGAHPNGDAHCMDILVEFELLTSAIRRGDNELLEEWILLNTQPDI